MTSLTSKQRDLIAESLRRTAGFVANEAKNARGDWSETTKQTKLTKVQQLRELAFDVETGEVG